MKKVTILMLGLIVFLPAIYGQSFSEFESTLDNCGMIFDMPDGYIQGQITENHNMNYEYALTYPEKDFEVRYAVRPISYKHYENDSVTSQMEEMKAFRNAQYRVVLEAIILNITGGVSYKVGPFDDDNVKKEFNADWGGTTFVELNNSDFGKGFKYCMIVAIHKKDVADAYYFYLANSKENFMDYVKPLFHSLRFE